jgi:hypothetical protein
LSPGAASSSRATFSTQAPRRQLARLVNDMGVLDDLVASECDLEEETHVETV